MSKKHKQIYGVFNGIEHLLILIFTVTRQISISYFASLVGTLVGIMSSKIGLKICVITTGIKKYKLIIKKKKNGKILSSAKSKLNSAEVLISKA